MIRGENNWTYVLEDKELPPRDLHLKFLVLGCPRAGSTYMSRLFRCFGYKVPHEGEIKHCKDPDGISDWHCADPVDRKQLGITGWDQCILYTRHPLPTVHTLSTVEVRNPSNIDRLDRVMPDWSLGPNMTAVEWAVEFYLGWYNYILKTFHLNATIKVEEGPSQLQEYLVSTGQRQEGPPRGLPPQNVHSESSEFNPEALLNQLSASSINKLEGFLGYSMEDFLPGEEDGMDR